MSVVVNDIALSFLLRSPVGAVALDMEKRGRSVEELARQNASGQILGVRSGDLLAGLHVTPPVADIDGPAVMVSTPARHRGFAYPTFHDRHGRPWLTAALAEGFTRNI